MKKPENFTLEKNSPSIDTDTLHLTATPKTFYTNLMQNVQKKSQIYAILVRVACCK